jgi:SAM-dependent methyltransferase
MVAVAGHRSGLAAPLSDSIAFWHLGIAITASSAQTLLEPMSIDELAYAGLVVRRGDSVTAAVRISPFDDALIAHDFDHGGPLSSDFVLGVGSATQTLASLTPRGRVGRTLDLGTGSGSQALLAAAHSEQVVATDISERAVWMARLSAALSDRSGIDFRIGDTLEPVVGETFDLIVANPPYVVSPDSALVFRDTTASGDETSRSMVRDTASLLRDGGIACVLVNWIVKADTGETDAPIAWVGDLGCDAIILHHDTRDPLDYADRWGMLPSTAGPHAHAETLDRWLVYFDELGAKSIASGAIILRHRGAASRVRVEEMPKQPRNGGDHVMRMLDSFGRFKGPEDPLLPRAVFRLVHGHRLEQRLVYAHGPYQPRDAVLRLDRSAGVRGVIPADLLEVLFEIDGLRSIEAIAAEVAASREGLAREFRARILSAALRLYELGFLDLASPE